MKISDCVLRRYPQENINSLKLVNDEVRCLIACNAEKLCGEVESEVNQIPFLGIRVCSETANSSP